MIIVFDIGNTEIDIALFSENEKEPEYHFPLRLRSAEIDRELISILKQNKIDIKHVKSAVIGSVVPKETERIARSCRILFNRKPFIAISGKNTIIPIKYYPPGSIGIDRVANVIGAIEYYKKLPIIIIDLGTATTFTVASEKSELIGGAITIGLKTAIKALHQETALLPMIELPPKIVKSLPVIGSSTISNLQSGFFYGFIELVDGMVNRIKEKLSKPTQVIATGGLASLLAPASKTIQKADPLLTLKGLYTIYRKQ